MCIPTTKELSETEASGVQDVIDKLEEDDNVHPVFHTMQQDTRKQMKVTFT